ncbi:MAG TPA: type II secretion system protein [Candidatus Bathyarchaeia archaeon]|nr:type II secretion system protein [Candidatus Bathyarchaeia archaeon]
MRRARGARGFTLLEIAIGMAVLGVGVVAALQVFGGSLRLARAASRKSEAVVHAKALMDAVLWSPELEDGVTHGEIGDGFRWERRIRHAGIDDGLRQEDLDFHGELRLAVISVKVEWNEANGVKSYSIGTMRVVPDNG